MTLRKFCMAALGATALFLTNGTAGAGDRDPAILAFVDQINATTGSAAPGDKGAIRAACGKLVATAFDLDTMVVAASNDTWKRMNAKQKSAYRAGLESKAARQCASRGKEVAGQKVELVGVRAGKGAELQVAVQRMDGKGRVAIWKVIPAGGAVRAIDIVVDGHSLVNNVRNQARQLLEQHNGNVEVLIKAVGS